MYKNTEQIFWLFFKKVLTNYKKEYKISLTKNEQQFGKHKFARSDIKMKIMTKRINFKITIEDSIERHPVPVLGTDYKVKIVYKK